MTTTAVVALAALAVVAPINWWSRWTEHRPTELWSKPLATVLVIVAALAVDGPSDTVTAWVVAALVCSLAGDVALMAPSRWFLVGLASFLLAHVLYIAAFLASPGRRWWGLAVGLAITAVTVATIGRRLAAATAERDPALRPAVLGYMAVILAMSTVAWVTGPPLAVVGASAFLVSDSLLAWNRFVAPARWLPVGTMVTYHAAQVLIAVPLVLG